MSPGGAADSVDPAVERGIFFAREMNAALHLLLCEFEDSGHAASGSQHAGGRELLRQVQDGLAQYTQSLAQDGLRVSADVIMDRHPLRAVTDKIEALRPDIVIKTTRHDSRLNRTLFNFTDWQLIRSCPSPLLLAKSEDSWSTRRIVACVNPGHVDTRAETLDQEIVESAEILAHRLRGELFVFHSVEPWPHLGPLPSGEAWIDQKHSHQLMDDRRRLIEDVLLRPYGISPSRLHLEMGRPTKTLLPFIRTLDASLVVMGAVSKGALETLLIGNTAERMLDVLPCDILVVKLRPLEAKACVPEGCMVC
jgi:universal stress protein E